MIGEIDSL
jgi:hypothetical protein